MDYEKKYKQIHKFISDLYPFMSEYCKEKVEGFLPELKESEDEKIRKFLIKWIQDNYYHGTTEIPTKTLIAWLEKQGSEPNWCHHKVDLSNCSEEYRKAYYDGWNNCNQQHSQCKSEWNDVVKCLINGMKFYYEDNEEATWGTEKFSMKVKDILSWLEKQRGEMPADKVKPKFKVGDWIIYSNEEVHLITGLDDNGYFVDEESYIPFNCEGNMRLWTIADAKDGDALRVNYLTFLFREVTDNNCQHKNAAVAYCSYVDGDDGFGLSGPDCITNLESIHPVTKEQRNILFQKMHEAAYEWDAEKKELKKVEQEPA